MMQTYAQKLLRKQRLVQKHKLELDALLADCPHDEIVERSRYFEGSYYDRASTDRWNECLLCGKRSEVTTETHSWYG